jgi:hypothetical protein
MFNMCYVISVLESSVIGRFSSPMEDYVTQLYYCEGTSIYLLRLDGGVSPRTREQRVAQVIHADQLRPVTTRQLEHFARGRGQALAV